MRGAVIPLPNTPSLCGAQLKSTGTTCTFYLTTHIHTHVRAELPLGSSNLTFNYYAKIYTENTQSSYTVRNVT